FDQLAVLVCNGLFDDWFSIRVLRRDLVEGNGYPFPDGKIGKSSTHRRIAGDDTVESRRIALREHHAFAAASRASGEVRMSRRLCVVLGNQLFGERRHLDISEVCKVQIGLFVFHEAEIKSSPMAFMS